LSSLAGCNSDSMGRGWYMPRRRFYRAHLMSRSIFSSGKREAVGTNSCAQAGKAPSEMLWVEFPPRYSCPYLTLTSCWCITSIRLFSCAC